MEIISNIIEKSEYAICYITIFDEHFAQNLITIYGQEKAKAIILNGKKYDDKYNIVVNYEGLIIRFDFHPTSGLLIKTYDFNHTVVKSDNESFKEYLRNNNLTGHILDIEAIKKNPTANLKIKIITPTEYLFNKFK